MIFILLHSVCSGRPDCTGDSRECDRTCSLRATRVVQSSSLAMQPGQLLSVRGLLAHAGASHALQCRIAQQTTPRGWKQPSLYSTQVLCPSALGMLARISST